MIRKRKSFAQWEKAIEKHKCYACGKFGHYAKICSDPQKKREWMNKQNKKKTPTKPSEQSDEEDQNMQIEGIISEAEMMNLLI